MPEKESKGLTSRGGRHLRLPLRFGLRPQDIAEVKRLVGDKVALIGNVNCAALQTGTDEEVRESVLYALQNGMPGYGYVFSTSNCVYTGMPLKRYDFMLDLWRKYGNYT